MRSAPYVRVAVPAPLPEPLTYAVPPPLREVLQPGHAVMVPLGPRLVTGWVVEGLDEPDLAPERIRDVHLLLDPVPVVDPVQMEFLKWAAKYYLASLGEMLATALPSGTRAGARRVLVPEPAASEALAADSVRGSRAVVLREIIRKPGLTPRALVRILDGEVDRAEVLRGVEALREAGLVRGELRETGTDRDRSTQVQLRLEPGQLLDRHPRAGTRMREVVALLAEAGGTMDLTALTDACGQYAADAVRKLAALDVVRLERVERTDPVAAGTLAGAAPRALPPTPAQSAAIEAIAGHEGYGVFLLHGVTGSGKTEVYLQIAERVLGRGRQVLVLVPEIGLTPQLVGRFRARFGDAVAVLHSGLSGRDRLREWRRVRAGRANVAVGARSALFAPFGRLGLVVVDEEHDDSYKQDEGVRYHARDLAVVRGLMARCPVVLGSATPSLESVQNGEAGRYRVLRLPDRATARPVPEVELVDMRREPHAPDGETPLLSARLVGILAEALDAGGKAILLYNRRGWATVVECPDCGSGFTCPSCGISLVLHRRAARGDEPPEPGRLTCHYCGFQRRNPVTCPLCSGTLVEQGHGTERVEEAVARAFPGVPIGRMDADTTAGRGAHQRILEAFRSGAFRLLVGTQLVAKGHDFPDVAVAAVVGMDHVLTMPDFRAAERTWALVTQLAGRAGRGDRAGQVVLQTWHPDHFVFQMLHDGAGFRAREMRVRRLLGYPPFSRLVMVRLEGVDQAATRRAGEALARDLRASLPPDGSVDVLGPAPAPLARLVGRWRFQVVLRGRQPGVLRKWLEERWILLRDGAPHGVRIAVDVDPRSLL